MSRSVLVTGSDGFIASHLIPALERSGYDVVRHSRSDGDIRNCPLQVAGVRHVFHLGARTFVPNSWTAPRDFYETNVIGTVNVLEHCRSGRIPVTLLSSYVYGQPISLPISEDHPLRALNPYAHSKILAEEAAAYFHREFGIPLTIIRPFNVYGSGQNATFVIPRLVSQVLDPRAEEVRVNDERPRRDYVYVRDLVDLLVRTIERRGDGRAFNAGSGESISVKDLAGIIARVAGVEKPFASEGARRNSEVLDVVADISRAATVFGWRPATPLDIGLAEIIHSAAMR